MMRFKAKESDKNLRLDKYLARRLPEVGRTYVQRLLEHKKVKVNKTATKPGYKLKAGDVVDADYNPADSSNIPQIDLPIIYEDDDCLVINKPAGILTHSKGPHNPEASVASFISKYTHGLSGNRAGIVHRLDRATSGVIVVAKDEKALGWLQKQFSQRKVRKEYIAVVNGLVRPEKAEVQGAIERNPKRPQSFRIGSNGKPAVTEYEVLATGNNCSLVRLKPQTGRTHQLRVHMAHLGHPILGDLIYGGRAAERLYLHAKSLEITLPDKSRKTFTVEPPREFKDMLEGNG